LSSLEICIHFDVNLSDGRLGGQIQSLERSELISSIDGRNIHFI